MADQFKQMTWIRDPYRNYCGCQRCSKFKPRPKENARMVRRKMRQEVQLLSRETRHAKEEEDTAC